MSELLRIFDAAMIASDRIHREARRREITQSIRETENNCGSCQRWMTDACPRERRDRFGTKVGGPSCATLKCSAFEMNSLAARHIVALRAELAPEPTHD